MGMIPALAPYFVSMIMGEIHRCYPGLEPVCEISLVSASFLSKKHLLDAFIRTALKI